MNKENWIQTGILIATLLGLSLGVWQQSKQGAADVAARFARIEQRLDDHEQAFRDLKDAVTRIEDKLQ